MKDEPIENIVVAFIEGTIKSKVSSRNHYIRIGKPKKAFKLNDEINYLWHAKNIIRKI